MTKDEQWQMSIGRLIYSFGFIELYLNHLLMLWLDQEIYETQANERRTARNELIAIVGDRVMHVMVTAKGLNDPRLKGAAKLLNAEIAGVTATS